MRSAYYWYGQSKEHTSSYFGSCFQIAKASKYFKYSFTNSDVFDFTEKGSIPECIEIVCKMVNDFIKESGLNVEFKYSKGVGSSAASHSFEFISTEPTNKYFDVYATMIISRFFVSCFNPYRTIIWIMYQMYKRGFSVIESYIIASMYDGYPSYSFSGIGVLSIHKYRKLKSPKVLFENTGTGLVAKFTTALAPSKTIPYHYGPFMGIAGNDTRLDILKTVHDLYALYLQCLDEFESIPLNFVKFKVESLDKLQHDVYRKMLQDDRLYTLGFNQGFAFPMWNNFIKIYDDKKPMMLSFGLFCQNDFEVVNTETFANDFKDLILNPKMDSYVYSRISYAIKARGLSFNDLKKMIK